MKLAHKTTDDYKIDYSATYQVKNREYYTALLMAVEQSSASGSVEELLRRAGSLNAVQKTELLQAAHNAINSCSQLIFPSQSWWNMGKFAVGLGACYAGVATLQESYMYLNLDDEDRLSGLTPLEQAAFCGVLGFLEIAFGVGLGLQAGWNSYKFYCTH